MSVKKRVEEIFPPAVSWNVWQKERVQRSKSPKNKFRPRHKNLLQLEGVYDNPSFPNFKIHISCRFNDILRAGDTHHFFSCFGPGNGEKIQPFLRCRDSNWAVIFVTDKKGIFMGRCWLSYHPSGDTWYKDEYKLGRMYGNKLRSSDVYRIIESKLLQLYINEQCQDFRLTEGNPDKYIAY